MIDQAAISVDTLRAAGRAAMGVTGEEVHESLRSALRRSRSRTAVTMILVVDQLAIVLASLAVAGLVQRIPRRGLVASTTGVAWSVLTLLTGFVTSFWQLGAALIADGASSGSVHAVHKPLLLDTYPPAARVRVLSAYQVFSVAGSILSPALVALLTGPADLTWRGVFVVMGLICIAFSLVAVKLRDPGFGAQDTGKLREEVRADMAGRRDAAPKAVEDPATSLRVMEIVQRLLLIPTLRRSLAVAAALGVGLVPLSSYFSFFLQERWGLGSTQRALFFAVVPVFTVVMVIAGSRHHSSPAWCLRCTRVRCRWWRRACVHTRRRCSASSSSPSAASSASWCWAAPTRATVLQARWRRCAFPASSPRC